MQLRMSWVARPRRRNSAVTRIMLIQPNRPEKGTVRPEATRRPSSVKRPKLSPCSIINRQSAGTWFQPGSAERRTAAGMSAGVSRRCVERAGHALAFGALKTPSRTSNCVGLPRLGRSRADPVGDPVDHPGRAAPADSRTAPMPAPVLTSQAVRRFRAGDLGRLAEAAAERLRQRADADGLRPADVERRGRRGAMAQRAQRLRIGVALPDHVDMAHGHVDRLAGLDLARDVVQHAVAHVDRVVEPDQAARACRACARNARTCARARRRNWRTRRAAGSAAPPRSRPGAAR